MSEQVNSNIAMFADGLACPLKIVCWNIANAKRDNDYHPLLDRIPDVIATLLDISPDVFIWLEAGRDCVSESGDVVTFTEIAVRVQKETGLRYAGIDMLNATASPFGKAVFYNPQTTFVNKHAQQWTTDNSEIPSGDAYGNSMTTVIVYPVVKGRVVIDSSVSVCAVHLPMKRSARMQVCKFLTETARVNNRMTDIIIGDMNTFPDDGASDMISVLEEHFTEALPADTAMTFHAYSHDKVTVQNNMLHTMPLAEIVSTGETESVVIPVSWLDHCMVDRDYQGAVTASVYLNVIGSPSDHYPIIACVNANTNP